jgi:integrase
MARSPGEGTVSKNNTRNRWEAQLTIGYDPDTGQRKRQKFTGRTRAEVVDKLDDARKRLGQGRPTHQERRTVEEYLEDWIENVLPTTVSAGTITNYADVVRLYIVPNIGAKKLLALTPADVSAMVLALDRDGKSPNTQRLARSVLRRALRRGEQEGILDRNVAALADGVRVGAPEGRTLTVEQGRHLLDAVREDRLEAAYVTALTLGLRRGELLGLTWDDVDLDAERPTLTVLRSLKRVAGRGLEVSETKTRGSRRRIHLPAPTVDALRRHRDRIDVERATVGSSWPDRPLGVDLVFRSPIGTAVDPDNFRNATYSLTKRVLGERWSPHELRHSAASLLIAQGVDLKVVSEVLGHSSIRITSDVYGHLLDGAGVVAADAMSELFARPGGVTNERKKRTKASG